MWVDSPLSSYYYSFESKQGGKGGEEREIIQMTLKKTKKEKEQEKEQEKQLTLTIEEEDVFLIAQQGKSKFQTLFPYSLLKKSSHNLYGFEDARKEEMIVPEEDELGGLRGRMVVVGIEEGVKNKS